MIDDNNEQQGDSLRVDVETGERSDNVPSFEILENEGVKYVAANQADLYKAAKSEELAAMQTEIDGVLEQIAAIEAEEAAEERQQIMADFVAKFGDDYDLSEVVDFNNVEEFEQVMDYLNASYQSTFGNPSAGFGASKQAEPANSYKNQYERGAAAAREIFQKRGR